MSAVTTNSTRISKRFAELRASGELGIVAYIVAGDPSLDASLKYVLALAEAGADVIELGVPFSDPLADGPTIQRGAERALKPARLSPASSISSNRIRESSQSSARPLQLLQSHLANGPRKIRYHRRKCRRRWRPRDGTSRRKKSEDYRRILAAHHLDTIFLGAAGLPTSEASRNSRAALRLSSLIPAPRKMVSR